MLRPDEIRNKNFEKGSFGYKPEDVDSFLRRVADDYETLYNNSADSEQKIIRLVEKINEYREDEDAIKDALLSAQKEGRRILNEARAESERMISEAAAKTEEVKKQCEEESERIIQEHQEYCARIISENTSETEKKIEQVKNEYAVRSQELKDLKREIAQFKAQLTEIYSQQIQLVMQMPDGDGESDDESVSDEPAKNAQSLIPDLPSDPSVKAVELKTEKPKWFTEKAESSEKSGSTDDSEKTEAAAVSHESSTQDISALKDESVFSNQKPREVKFSDLRFGNNGNRK